MAYIDLQKFVSLLDMEKINVEFKTEECISTGYMVIRRRYNV